MRARAAGLGSLLFISSLSACGSESVNHGCFFGPAIGQVSDAAGTCITVTEARPMTPLGTRVCGAYDRAGRQGACVAFEYSGCDPHISDVKAEPPAACTSFYEVEPSST